MRPVPDDDPGTPLYLSRWPFREPPPMPPPDDEPA
jgi:hypothetical protein